MLIIFRENDQTRDLTTAPSHEHRHRQNPVTNYSHSPRRSLLQTSEQRIG